MSRLKALLVIAGLLAGLLPAGVALAHTGPPFVVLSERPVGPYTATVWADPDVGAGSFIIEASRAGAALPEGASVTVSARPLGGGGGEVSGPAERQETNGGRVFLATLPLGGEGDWEARVTIEGPDGRGEAGFQLQVTPAIEGWVTTTLCMLPFALVGAAWLVGLWLQRRNQTVKR
jgi:hypothetical protein